MPEVRDLWVDDGVLVRGRSDKHKVAICPRPQSSLDPRWVLPASGNDSAPSFRMPAVDVYFSADVETDGPIPGPYSMLSFALVFAGTFDGLKFCRPSSYEKVFYAELKQISDDFEIEALEINGLDRDKLRTAGQSPEVAMTAAHSWVKESAGGSRPVLVAYPLSFDWAWLYWYFMRYSDAGSPFGHSQCFDLKTAFAVKAHVPLSEAGRSRVPERLRPTHPHSHHAVDDAVEQAEIFANIFEWGGSFERDQSP